ncbi:MULTISPECIES: hypothetical protein [unclassified Lysinibacillus]|uniref:hypothetical protein n=1 Tax=unclassified Lysinibacillus TaxID=2636778 RepID=UPI0038288A2B
MNLGYIQYFLETYTEFRIREITTDATLLVGHFKRDLTHEKHGEVSLDYSLLISVPFEYPKLAPQVFEESKRITVSPENHINYDGSLCLGTPFRINALLKRNPSLTYFFDNCILPFLYSVTLKNKTGNGFVFGETEHGNKGVILDLQELFHLSEIAQVVQMLMILSKPKKEANKLICPCGCSRRVTTCSYFYRVLSMRKYLSRSEWEDQFDQLKRG